MNWKEHAHLFANGKFKAQINWGNGEKTIETIDGYFLDYDDEGESWGLGAHCMPLSYCTLIARRIEDMTDAEKEEFLQRGEHHNDDILFESVHTDFMSATAFLYLLSIGVYPFDQSAFDNGTVIDAKH